MPYPASFLLPRGLRHKSSGLNGVCPLPENEEQRLNALSGYGLEELSAAASGSDLEELAKLAARLCGTRMAMISVVERERQWFLASAGLSLQQMPREISFCSHTILRGRLMVEDARLDRRFFHGNSCLVLS